MSNNGLEVCGHCGGEAKFEISFSYPGPRVFTRCKKCGQFKGPYIFHEQNVNFRWYRKGEAPSAAWAIYRAREDWNNPMKWRSTDPCKEIRREHHERTGRATPAHERAGRPNR